MTLLDVQQHLTYGRRHIEVQCMHTGRTFPIRPVRRFHASAPRMHGLQRRRWIQGGNPYSFSIYPESMIVPNITNAPAARKC